MKKIKLILPILLIFLSYEVLQTKNIDVYELYKTLHANPELSFQEEATSRRLADILKSLGYEVTENFGGYGLVATLDNGEGKTILIRADMDGLPVEEETKAAYASNQKKINQFGEEVYAMHACGHDIHMSVLIGVAQEFINSMETWSGRLIMVLQPAEEVSGGAKAMIAAGLFKKFPRPDYNLALHVSADIPSGKIGVIEEWAMANVDSVDITVKGIGGHGAYPHKTIDSIVLSSQIINAIQTIVSREIAPIQPAVITVGSIHGGTKHNIIPNEVKLQLTIRSYTDEVRNKILSSIKRIARAQALSAGVPDGLMPVINIKDEYTPAVYNDPELTKELKLSFISALEEKNVLEISPVMAGEDFGRFGRVEPKIPTALFWLGAVNKRLYKESLRKEITLPSLHSSKFLPEYEPTIDTGIKAMSSAIRRLL